MLQPLNRCQYPYQVPSYGVILNNAAPNHIQKMNETRKAIDHYSYGLNEEIGRGFSSRVYKGRDENTQQPVAVKVIDMKMIKQSIHATLLKNEINALKSLSQRNILKLYDVFQTQNNTYIITEFCDSGDLNAMIKRKGRIDESEAIRILTQVCHGLQEMNKKSKFYYATHKDFIHRDIKPANILIDKNVPKIADFGFAIQNTYESKSQGKNYNVGTPLYMSPQVLRQQGHSEKGDVWATGVMYFEMLFGRTPFNGHSEAGLLSNIMNQGLQIPAHPAISENSKDFIRRCLIIDDTKRWTIRDMCSHRLVSTEIVERTPLMMIPQNEVKQRRSQSFQKELQHNKPISSENIQHKNAADIYFDQRNPNKRSPTDLYYVQKNQVETERGDQVVRSRSQKHVFDPKNGINQNKSFDQNFKIQPTQPPNQQIQQPIPPPPPATPTKFKANNDILFSQINFCRFLYKFSQQLMQKPLRLSNQLQDKTIFLIAKNIAMKINKLQSINENGKENIFGLEDLENYKKSESYQKFGQAIWEYNEKYKKHFTKVFTNIQKQGIYYINLLFQKEYQMIKNLRLSSIKILMNLKASILLHNHMSKKVLAN